MKHFAILDFAYRVVGIDRYHKTGNANEVGAYFPLVSRSNTHRKEGILRRPEGAKSNEL